MFTGYIYDLKRSNSMIDYEVFSKGRVHLNVEPDLDQALVN